MALFGFFKDNDAEQAEPEAVSADPGAAAAGSGTDGLFDRVNAIIEEVRPYLQNDGGDVELMKVEDGVAYVRLVGACVGCPSSTYTLRMGIEARVREALPEIEAVEAI